MYTIYAIHNNVDGRIYVGQTKQNLRRRFQAHISNRSLVGEDIRAVGRQFFTIVPLNTAENQDEADREEINAIEFFSSIHPYGYNLEAGGRHAAKTEELKARMRNRVVSESTRAKLSKSMKGHPVTPAMLEALRIGRTLRKPESSKGEKNGRAVLDWEKVRTIRQLYRQGLTQQSIADNFGVKQVTISAIVRGKHWTGGELMDVTEDARREISQGINGNPQGRAGLEAAHGQVWDTEELTQDFLVLAFANPLVVVKRKTDGVKGSLFFQGTPRLYFKFEEAIVSER